MTTTTSKGTEQATTERSGGTRFLIGLFKFLLLLLFIAAGIFLGYLGWQQFNYINVVNDVQSERISRIDSEMILASDVESEIRANNQAVQNDLAAMQDQIDDLLASNQALQRTLDEQAAVINNLSSSAGAIDTAIANLQEGSDALGSALLALQQDITGSTTDLDSIGAEVDTLLNSVAAIDRQISELEETVEDIAANPPVVAAEGEDGVIITAGPDMAVWRLWGLVMRTKIHLAENDIEAANTALDSAIDAATNLASDEDDTLTTLLEQLESAAEDLLSKPAAANRTLDEALDTLDGLLN